MGVQVACGWGGGEEEGWMGRGMILWSVRESQRSLNVVLSLRMPLEFFKLKNVRSLINN